MWHVLVFLRALSMPWQRLSFTIFIFILTLRFSISFTAVNLIASVIVHFSMPPNNRSAYCIYSNCKFTFLHFNFDL